MATQREVVETGGGVWVCACGLEAIHQAQATRREMSDQLTTMVATVRSRL